MTVVRLGQRQPERRISLFKRRVTPGVALLIILSIAVLRLWVVETAIVEGHSMAPTLRPGDRVLVLKLLSPERFDVVLLTDPDARETSIKRVVGMPGDSLAMVGRTERKLGGRYLLETTDLYLNGEFYEEPYVSSNGPERVPLMRLGEDSYFVLGDNRSVSVDSREYGPVEGRLVHGVAVAVVYPPGRIGVIGGSGEPAAAASAGSSR